MPVDPIKGHRTTTARVDLKLTVAVNTNWGEGTPIADVFREAQLEAEAVIGMLLSPTCAPERVKELVGRLRLVSTVQAVKVTGMIAAAEAKE